ncbi:Shedu anti-phage system protein SduA domain-containing protein [Vibrio atlanticus]|uniref:Shedu anti-phage system protein SduA domain-containing protein n=1 Tax=Vibrio atlanticus TaxID=693153 RepID=UPI0035501125
MPKKKLGEEFITDYVLETLSSEYILVEIEKPSDQIFTKSNDFHHKFTHAFGQVLDFIEWVEQNIAYAQKKLPNISSPTGLLIIGMREYLNDEQIKKLNRFNKNSSKIKVLTFDDLLFNTKQLQNNIRARVKFNT